MSYTATAQALADTGDLARVAASMAGRCVATGLDLTTYRGIIAAAIALGQRPMRDCPRWDADQELITAVHDLEIEIGHRARRVDDIARTIRAAIRQARSWLTSEDEDVAARARAVIADCRTALEILEPIPDRLRYAAARLIAVPGELGETYAAAYALIARGRTLPHEGRWVTGARTSAPTRQPARL
ncbi:hypothetical protein [Sphaerisporangium rhizosphaerae]|uniref:DUF222 domain-containing protein n=1 Tax=Sphaerisporangium rhizosphaerae TaxID=2269375 RepID=A0ABW2NZA2_9ACTN